MSDEIEIAEDGRMFCPNCLTCESEIELRYHVLHHRKDISKVRFNQKDDTLVLIGDPVDGDTLEVYDEYLFCPHCGTRYNIPWSEDGDQQQDMVEYEGDFLRDTKPDTPPAHQCPKCASTTRVKHVEDYEISRYARPPDDDFEDGAEEGEEWIIVEGEDKIEYDGGGENEHLECYDCHCKWSIPSNVQIDYK